MDLGGKVRFRRVVVAAGAVAAIGLLTGGMWTGAVQAAELADARAELSLALDRLDRSIDRLESAVETADDALAEAEALHAESAGRTPDDAPRAALEAALEDLGTKLAAANELLEAGRDAKAEVAAAEPAGGGSPATSDRRSVDDLADATARIEALSASAARVGLVEPLGVVRTAEGEVHTAIALRDQQIAREQAEAAAAAAAAAAAEAAARAQAEADADGDGRGSPAPRAARGPAAPGDPWASAYHEYVWTSGFNAEIDACRGSVDISGNYGMPAVGEHWSCTGWEFPRSAGAYVVFEGVRSGLYRVEGVVAVLDQTTQSTDDLPGGYDLLYQTCLDGDVHRMALVGLTRVG